MRKGGLYKNRHVVRSLLLAQYIEREGDENCALSNCHTHAPLSQPFCTFQFDCTSFSFINFLLNNASFFALGHTYIFAPQLFPLPFQMRFSGGDGDPRRRETRGKATRRVSVENNNNNMSNYFCVLLCAYDRHMSVLAKEMK